MEIKNKTIIITGASSGIGAATAKVLSEQGAKIALVARRTDKINELAKFLPDSLAITADMSEPDDIKLMVEKVKNYFGKIDVLINNAGQGYSSLIEKIDIGKFKYLLDLNLIGTLVAMQEVIPIMRKQKQGLIINISSGTSLMYLPNVGAYSSTKRALNGISLTAREELAKDNIKVSILHPYITTTNFYENAFKSDNDKSALRFNNPEMPSPDSAEYVAQKILEAIISEKAEIFARDFMKKGN